MTLPGTLPMRVPLSVPAKVSSGMSDTDNKLTSLLPRCRGGFDRRQPAQRGGEPAGVDRLDFTLPPGGDVLDLVQDRDKLMLEVINITCDQICLPDLVTY